MPIRKLTVGYSPSFTLTLSVALALTLVGIFLMVLFQAASFSDYLKRNLRLQVYLDRSLSPTEVEAVKDKIEALGVVNPEPKSLTFISKDQAAKEFISETGEDFYQFLGENPLRDRYEVSLKPELVSVEGMGDVAKKISGIGGVFEVKYVRNLVSAVTQNLSRFLFVLGLLSALLISTAVLIINNTIRLALHSQRLLIRSMQLVGADPWFIQRPFVVRSILQGIYAALIAGAILFGFYQWLYTSVPEFQAIYSPATLAAIIFTLAMVGAIIGGLSSLFSVRRLLRLSLDQMY